MPSDNETVVALLLLPIHWRLPQAEKPLSDNISVTHTKKSALLKLYRRLCRIQNVDDGSPLGYDAYFTIREKNPEDPILHFGDPYALVDRLTNICAIVASKPMFFSRVIWSSDGFLTSGGTIGLHFGGQGTDALGVNSRTMMHAGFYHEVRHAWAVAQAGWEAHESGDRLQNALTNFYYAWNSQYLEQTCVYLAIALENLFAPHTAGESTHQVCFYISRFVSNAPEERKQAYTFFKKFYSTRSAIVHGGTPSYSDLHSVVTESFLKVSSILKSILLKEQLAQTFASDNHRRQLLEEYLFH